MKRPSKGRTWKFIKLIGLIGLPVALWLLPANFFDGGPPMCLSVILLGQECYGCGMTRACQHCIHGDFRAAYDFNKMVFIVLPILIYLYAGMFLKAYREFRVAK